jgi:hypothetical protein
MIRLGIWYRLCAAAHVLKHGSFTDHRIWRVTSHYGWNLKRIFCECGKEWTKPGPGDATPAQLLEWRRKMFERRARRKQRARSY